MNIEDLTLKQIKEIQSIGLIVDQKKSSEIDKEFLGSYVIIRTYSAGVWAGFLDQKERNEVILTQARRLWRWKAIKSISLSGIAIYGIDHDRSIIAPPVDKVWLEAIEIIPTSKDSENLISGAPHAEAQ